MKYNYDEEYCMKFANTREERIEQLRYSESRIRAYRMKTIVSGSMLECEIYPVFKGGRVSGKSKARGCTSAAQKKLNDINLRKRVVRLVNANFDEKDIWITVGYRNGRVPANMAEARRDVTNYIRRLQREAEKQNFDELKYVYVTEFDENKQMHHHIVTNFPDRDIAEKKWGHGEYPQARRLKPNDFGLEGLARYIAKDLGKSKKSYGYSLNLYKSWQHAVVADDIVTTREVERIACESIDVKALFERFYKGYKLNEVESYYSENELLSGCFVYARMRKNTSILQSTANKLKNTKRRRE